MDYLLLLMRLVIIGIGFYMILKRPEKYDEDKNSTKIEKKANNSWLILKNSYHISTMAGLAIMLIGIYLSLQSILSPEVFLCPFTK